MIIYIGWLLKRRPHKPFEFKSRFYKPKPKSDGKGKTLDEGW
jgi:hypothetical protein